MFDIVALIKAVGYVGILFMVFAESGLLIGFMLPGDSLLFTSGFLASEGYLNIWILAIGSFICAVLGDAFGYYFGKKVGPKIFTKENSLIFNKENLLYAQSFFEKHGKKTIILARFMPIVRTFAPILAGVGQMQYRIFALYNVIGAGLWALGLTFSGYYLGRIIPDADTYIIPIVLAIIFFSIAPSVYHVLKDEKQRTRIITFARTRLQELVSKIKK